MVGVYSKWFRQWQSIRRPSFWQSVVLCLLSSRFRRIEHQTRWTCTALWPRSVALRIRSLPHEVLLAQLGIGDAAETTASVYALQLNDPPRAVVTIDDDEDDFGTDIRMHEELKRVKMVGSVARTSLVRLFFSCQVLFFMPLLGCHASGTCSNFFSGCLSPIS